MRLIGASPDAQATALGELPGKSNYFIGNDPKKWRTDVPTYAKVKYQNLYPGIDLIYYGNQGQLEYDFVVAPGANPKAIRLALKTGNWETGNSVIQIPKSKIQNRVRIDAQGHLVVESKQGEIRFHRPVVYQVRPPASQLSGSTNYRSANTDNPQSKRPDREYLHGRYVLMAKNEVRFEVEAYDRRRQLVIDPVLSYSTYLGGSDSDTGNGIAVDSTGAAYVTGETASVDFPTMNPYQVNLAGASDVFVTKLDPTGTAIVYSTYIGGMLSDRGNSIAIDSAGNASITGRTNSTDFPVTKNAWQSQLFGDFDAFVTELNAQGNGLLYSSYLGGHGNDEGSGIAVDSLGNIYVTGGVGIGSEDDFPRTPGAFQDSYGGGTNDAFVTKFDPTQSQGNSLVYSTFLGGEDVERGNSIAVDSDGNAYVTGRTRSTQFPTRNPLQGTYGGGLYDAFVTKLNSTGDAVYSTYIGGSARDQGYAITVDSSGNAYITGETLSDNFPTTPNAYQSANAGSSDAFFAKIDATGSSLVYSTYLGGSDVDLGSGIALDLSGIAYITGRTFSNSDFPTTPNAIQFTFGGGGSDSFVAKIDPAQSGAPSLVYSSYLGGSGDENIPSVGPGGNPTGGIAVDSSGNIYVTGNTSSTDFPSVNPFQPVYNGGPSDAFVTKISSNSLLDFAETVTPSSQTIVPGGQAGYTITVNPTTGFTGDVTPGVIGLPDGASATFEPPVITITDSTAQSSTMTVMTGESIAIDTYPLTITTTSGTLEHDASVTLVVVSPSTDLSTTKIAR